MTRFVSSETRAKISEKARGRVLTPEHRAKIAQAQIGRPPPPRPSAEVLAKMSAAKKGIPLTAEHRANISKAIRGKAKSPEHVEKLRLNLISARLAKQYPGKLPKSVTERRRHLKREYGLTEEIFEEMLGAQNGRCAICQSSEHSGRNWHVDHCHNSGRVRGLLCSKCNHMLGSANDSVETLLSAVKYLERCK